MTADAYQAHAGVYDRIYEPAARRLRAVGLKLYPPKENLAILDIGCGTGTQLALYRRAGCRLTGVDLSPAMLRLARQKLGDSAELRAEDATHMTFARGSFDLVTMVLVLHEMPPAIRPAVMAECRRVAKPGGRIMLMDYHAGPYPFPRGWIWRLLVTGMEISAGREHFANYGDFIAHGALEPLAGGQDWLVDQRFILESGVAAVYLLRPAG